MATRTLLFDLARIDGIDTTPHPAQVQVSLLRPQQDNTTTVTAVPLVVGVNGPTRVNVPVTAPGNALIIHWPPNAARTNKTHHLIPDGEGELLAATLPLVDPATLAPTAHPEAAWWEAVKGLTGGGASAPPTIDADRHVLTFQIGD